MKRILVTLLSICMVFSTSTISYAKTKELPKPQIIIDQEPKIEPTNPKVGDEVTITYKVRPQPFTHNIAKDKEIVLVLDSSGSMSGNKMTNLKSAAKKFIEKMEDVENLKIGIVTYSSQATINPISKNGNKNVKPVSSSSSHKVLDYNSLTTPLLLDVRDEKLISIINTIEPLGGTNTGEGLRKAEYILRNGKADANKSIIFMSDGLPSFYSVKKQSSNYVNYLDIDNYDPSINGSGQDTNNTNVNNSTNYAKQIGDIIKKKSYNIFSIGYGLGSTNSTSNQKMKEIHQSMGGTSDTFFASDSGAIEEIFKSIADKIENMYSIQDAQLGVEIGKDIAPSQGFEVNDGKYSIKIPPITYERQENGLYAPTPSEVEIQFKVKVNQAGKVDIIKNGNLTYSDINGNIVEYPIPNLSITIGINSKVTIEASDSSGVIPYKYDSSEEATQRYDKKNIKNEFNQEYKLFGDSYANIQFEGDEINYLQYQVIKSDEPPNELPSEGWQEIYDGSGGIPGDIDPDKPGYLTQKSYDVSHMPHMSDNEKWKDRELVFKNPFNESKEKPATTTNNSNEYVKKVEYQYYNPQTNEYETRYRWESNNIFCNNMNIGGDYKEANKTWGYIKAPKTGKYKFRTFSDDGMYAKLTVDGKEIILVDNLTPHGSQVSAEVEVQLDKDKYYPIYIEYFNWGGWGHYELQYKAPGENNFKAVPSDCFYASSNTSPGEGGENSFTGSGNIKIPEGVGKYYIAYRSGIKEKNQQGFDLFKEGVYGPFNVDERFTLSRTLKENNVENSPYEYILEYKLQPNNLRVTDIYKTKAQLDQANNSGSLKQNLEILNTKIIDNTPEQIRISKSQSNLNSTHGFNPSVEEYIKNGVYTGSKVDGFIQGDIRYTLKKENSLYESSYTSEPIILNLGVNVENIGDLVFNKDNGILLYKDVSLNGTGANKEQNFPIYEFTIEGKNELKSHGIYNEKRSKFKIGSSEQEVVDGMYYQVGVDVELKRNNSNLILKAPNNVIDYSNIKVYRHDGNGNILEKIDNYNLSKDGDSIEVSGLSKGNYVITYVSTFTTNSSIDAILDKSKKTFKANLLGGGSGKPEDRLPDLF